MYVSKKQRVYQISSEEINEILLKGSRKVEVMTMDDISKKLLPIGTVVQLANKKEKIMICGRQQIDLENQEEYDYLGCVYPKGIDNEDVLLFNADIIVMVYFLGYQDLDEIHQRILIFDSLRQEESPE